MDFASLSKKAILNESKTTPNEKAGSYTHFGPMWPFPKELKSVSSDYPTKDRVREGKRGFLQSCDVGDAPW
jgi:hypothetical protein